MLRPEATQALGLAFHELATNAVKYGALSVPDGQIDIAWRIETEGKEDVFSWHGANEARGSGGPRFRGRVSGRPY